MTGSNKTLCLCFPPSTIYLSILFPLDSRTGRIPESLQGGNSWSALTGLPRSISPKKKFFVMIGIHPFPFGSIFYNVKVDLKMESISKRLRMIRELTD